MKQPWGVGGVSHCWQIAGSRRAGRIF